MADHRFELVCEIEPPTRPDIVLRTGRHHLRPGLLAVATGIAEQNWYAKTLIESASRKKP